MMNKPTSGLYFVLKITPPPPPSISYNLMVWFLITLQFTKLQRLENSEMCMRFQFIAVLTDFTNKPTMIDIKIAN
jgi:hypothetical protein